MASTIQVQIADELESKSEELFKGLGYEALSEAELLNKLKKSRQNAAQGNYRDASEVARDMREKYGL